MANAKPIDAAWADLPNGFHDAELQELNVDLAKAEVRMRLEFWTGGPGATEAEREATRLGTLRLQDRGPGVRVRQLVDPVLRFDLAITEDSLCRPVPLAEPLPSCCELGRHLAAARDTEPD